MLLLVYALTQTVKWWLQLGFDSHYDGRSTSRHGLRPNVRDRLTSDRNHHLMPPPYGGRGIITETVISKAVPDSRVPAPALNSRPALKSL